MPIQEQNDYLILYGSQTGQAEAISEEIYERSFREGFNPVRYTLGEIEKKFSLEKLKRVVIVCSTTGEGEPPDNALKFVRRIRKKTLSSRHLQHLTFTVLGLGDSNYTNFCNCPKGIISRLQELGASTFYDPGYADDAVGLEEVVEPWIDGLFPVLRKIIHNDSNTDTKTDTLTDTHTDKHTETDINSNLGVVNIGDKEIIAPTTPPPQQTMVESTPTMTTEVIEEKPNLRYSIEPLSTSTLKVPSAPPPFLEIVYLSPGEQVPVEQGFEYPGADTCVKSVAVTRARQLTFDETVKKALEVELDVKEFEFDFQPGDSFGIVCDNKKDEVEYLLDRLNITAEEANRPMTLKILPTTTKKSPTVPSHIHLPSTVRKVLTKSLDFRCVPRKAFIRMLVEYTSDEGERRRLQELCSVQGGTDYGTFVRGKYVGVIQLLQTFPTCQPPIVRLLELIPQLLPREYSIASYHNKQHGCMKFVFNVIELPQFQTEKRFGLCTSWLDSMTADIRSRSPDVLDEKMKTLTLENNRVDMYFRRPTGFRFPEDPSQPLIMIGPGTGVAPFIGFLEKRESLRQNNANVELGAALLFFGCRHHGKDDLYREELVNFKNNGILTELYTSYSRDVIVDESHIKYVQHNVKKHKDVVLDLLFQHRGAVFICGDAKFMGRDVTNTFVELIEESKNVGKVEAIKIVNGLRESKQFLEDVWT